MLGRLATLLAPPERAALATNILSAACTAGAGAIAARLVARWTGSASMGIAAALAAGSMSTVWLIATETEVYAAALLLAMLALWAADRAERGGGTRWVVLVAYLLALAPALHLITLLAAPAAIVLAASGAEGRPTRRVAIALSLVFVVAAGVGRGSLALALAAAVLLAALALLRHDAPAAERAPRDGAPATEPAPRRWVAIPTGALAATLVALSALAILGVRAAHDPPLNQGDPSTIERLADVVARRQYEVAPLWPRQAPLWLQGANLLQYADWQVALGVAPTVAPSLPRTALALGFLALGAVGSLAHRRRHRRSWRALAALALAGSVGAMLYLNLKAGPSIGWGILPDSAPHEARERDYFYVFAFWTWGLWAGVGAVEAARRARFGAAAGIAGIALASMPIPLNWRATDRTREPEASIARTTAVALLRSVPPRGVLFVAADNDTYPLWYVQQVEGVRRDVTVVAVPLLAADWYAAELLRRDSLLTAESAAEWRGTGAMLGALAEGARRHGRPLAASPTVSVRDRGHIARGWTLAGFVYVADGGAPPDATGDGTAVARRVPRIDSAAARDALRWRDERLAPEAPRPSTDPVARQLRAMLECPRWALDAGGDRGAARSLDSVCNFR